MPIDALSALTQLATTAPHEALHVLQNYAVDKAGDFVANALFRGVRRAVRPSFKSERELEREDIEALGRLVEALIADVRRDELLLTRENDTDRATDTFVAEAVSSALESPYPAKHMILGRLIGDRLRSETESRDELFLRESLRIVRGSNQNQLFALASLYLVHHPPESLMPIESLFEWWDAEYFPLLQRFIGGWNLDDLHYLERLGAVTIEDSADADVLRLSERPGPAIDSVLLRRGLGPAVRMSSHVPGRSNFAVYVSLLHGGNAGSTVWPDPGIALFPFRLSVPGVRVALTIVNALSKRTIETSRETANYPFSDSTD